jgi:hypothetical protein
MHGQSLSATINAQDFRADCQSLPMATGIAPQIYLCTAEDGAGELS